MRGAALVGMGGLLVGEGDAADIRQKAFCLMSGERRVVHEAKPESEDEDGRGPPHFGRRRPLNRFHLFGLILKNLNYFIPFRPHRSFESFHAKPAARVSL